MPRATRGVRALARRSHAGQVTSEYLVIGGVIVAILLVVAVIFRDEIGRGVDTLTNCVVVGASGNFSACGGDGGGGAQAQAASGTSGGVGPGGSGPYGLEPAAGSGGSGGTGGSGGAGPAAQGVAAGSSGRAGGASADDGIWGTISNGYNQLASGVSNGWNTITGSASGSGSGRAGAGAGTAGGGASGSGGAPGTGGAQMAGGTGATGAAAGGPGGSGQGGTGGAGLGGAMGGPGAAASGMLVTPEQEAQTAGGGWGSPGGGRGAGAGYAGTPGQSALPAEDPGVILVNPGYGRPDPGGYTDGTGRGAGGGMGAVAGGGAAVGGSAAGGGMGAVAGGGSAVGGSAGAGGQSPGGLFQPNPLNDPRQYSTGPAGATTGGAGGSGAGGGTGPTGGATGSPGGVGAGGIDDSELIEPGKPHVAWRHNKNPLTDREFEHIARNTAYTGGREYSWNGAFKDDLKITGLEMLDHIDDKRTGFQAVLMRDVHNPKDIIIAFRGTELNVPVERLYDGYSDIGAVGNNQYAANRDKLSQWAQQHGGNITVVGHSLGGALGQRFIVDHGDKVKNAVFFNSAAIDEGTAMQLNATGQRIPPINYYMAQTDPVPGGVLPSVRQFVNGREGHVKGHVTMVDGAATSVHNNAWGQGMQALGPHQGNMLQGGTTLKPISFAEWQQSCGQRTPAQYIQSKYGVKGPTMEAAEAEATRLRQERIRRQQIKFGDRR